MSVTKVSSPMIEGGTKGADIASAATVVIGTDGSYFDITGTTGISTQFTVDAGRRFTLQFDGIVTITDNAAITLSGAVNFTTAAGDILSFVATAANTVVQTGYSLVDGGSPVAPSGGKIVQVVNAINNAYSSGSTVAVGDNTIPQNDEGMEVMTLAITPTSASNKLLIHFSASNITSSALGGFVTALFQDSTANALSGVQTTFTAGWNQTTELTHYMTSGTTSSTTFKIRLGNINAATTYINGNDTTRQLGGVGYTILTITEISV